MILEGNWIRCMTRPKFCVIPRLIFSILILWLFSRTDLEIKTETFGFLWQYRDPQKIGKIPEMLHSELSRWERPFWAIREPLKRILYCLATGIYVPGCCYDVVQPVASLIECGRELWGTFIVLGGAPSTLSWGGSPTSSYSSDPPQPLLFAAFVSHSISLACLRTACFLVTLQSNGRKGRQKDNDSELHQQNV